MSRRLGAVIWDMGGILHKTPFEVLPEIERRQGLPAGTYPRGPFDPAGDPDYEAMARGEIREPEYWRIQQAKLSQRGVDLDIHRTIDWTSGHHRTEVLAAIREIGKHLPQAILTNDATEWLGRGWRTNWPLRNDFQAMVDAAEEGIRKPAAAIYRRCADALGVAPELCLFVDDLPVNVAGADAAGMEGFWFDVRRPDASMRRLLERLGLDVTAAQR